MRVAFLTHEPFHPPSGGGSAEAPYLIREFVRRGHEVHLFCPAFPDAEAVAARFGIRVHPFTRWRMGRYTRLRNLKYLLYPSALTRMVRDTAAGPAFRAAPFDLIFAQHTISAVAAARLRRELRIPAVFNFLDYLTGFMETWPAWVMPGPGVRQLTRFELSLPRRSGAEGVLTVSQPLADRFAATGYPKERLCAIQYGYDAALFRPDEAADAEAAPSLVMHGSFDHHHLGPIALEAMTRVAAARPDLRLRLVGRETPALRGFLARLRSRTPGLRVETTGFVPYETVAREVASAAVGLVPYEESNGTHCAFVAKAVEYLGCGVPVASTPLENLSRYFAREPAIRFSEFDGASFAAAVLAWVETPAAERRRLGLAAAGRVAAELDWAPVTRRALEFVEATVAGSLRGGH
ncbi:MAG: glycosyltransferase family 4 protein [Verrucomicrobiae bacterium]|nr:glycosyltransferase family 4 protein [Verrucomicrobiae bacterium]